MVQVRFLHDPDKATGFAGCALSSTMVIYFKNEDETWSHGDIRQYNIDDPKTPVLTGLHVGGLIQKGSHVLALGEEGKTFQFDVPKVKVR